MEKVLFKEEQRFTQWWLWLIMIITLLSVLVPFGYGIYSQEVMDKPFGDNPMSTGGLIVTGTFSVLIVGAIVLLLFGSRLKTQITAEALFVSFPPLINKEKKFVPEEIEKYEIRTYRANIEYGGYGIKSRKKYGQSYTISGNTGLQLYFKNGKRLLIGTQRKQAIDYAMDKLMNKGD
ncbi:MAG: hypothetical protein R3182_02025 [Draconibacterium sp.]|nr:hypothetical protein [Draconibacterium sp.]